MSNSGLPFESASAVDRYQNKERLGEGSYGYIYIAYDQENGKRIVLKKLVIDPKKVGLTATALREVSLRKDLTHSNIISLLDVIPVCSPPAIYLVLEFMNTDLTSFLRNTKRPLCQFIIRSFMKQMLEAVKFMHKNMIIHGDLAPANILLSNEGVLKLVDFGLAQTFDMPLHAITEEVVTLPYKAPEILLGVEMYTMDVDMWSLGCIFTEFFRETELFELTDADKKNEKRREIILLHRIFGVMGTPNNKVWPGVTRLPKFVPTFPKWEKKALESYLCVDKHSLGIIKKMLVYKPNNRSSAHNILMDEAYFEDAGLVDVTYLMNNIKRT